MFVGNVSGGEVPSSPPPKLIPSTPSSSPHSRQETDEVEAIEKLAVKDTSGAGKRQSRLKQIARARRKRSQATLGASRNDSTDDNDTDPTTATEESEEMDQKSKVIAASKRNGKDSKPRWSPKRLLCRVQAKQQNETPIPNKSEEQEYLTSLASSSVHKNSKPCSNSESPEADSNVQESNPLSDSSDEESPTLLDSSKEEPPTPFASPCGEDDKKSTKRSPRWVKAGTVHWIQAGTEQEFTAKNKAIAEECCNSPSSSMECNDGASEKMEVGEVPPLINESRSVRFSSEVCSIMGQADEYDRTSGAKEEKEVEDELSSSSLCLGGWIGDISESETSDGVAVVDMTKESFSECSALRVPFLQLTRASKPLANKKGSALPSTSRCNGRISPLCLREEESSSGESFNSYLDSDEHGGEGSEPWDETRTNLDCPISRRGRMWTKIVDFMRAVVMFATFAIIATDPPLCGNDERLFLATKLAGALFLCCLSCWSTGGHHGRLGWRKLREVVFSRKTALLLIYLWTWSCIVNTTMPSFFDIAECSTEERSAFGLSREKAMHRFETLMAQYTQFGRSESGFEETIADSVLTARHEDGRMAMSNDNASPETALGSTDEFVVEVVDFVVRATTEKENKDGERHDVDSIQECAVTAEKEDEGMDPSRSVDDVPKIDAVDFRTDDFSAFLDPFSVEDDSITNTRSAVGVIKVAEAADSDVDKISMSIEYVEDDSLGNVMDAFRLDEPESDAKAANDAPARISGTSEAEDAKSVIADIQSVDKCADVEDDVTASTDSSEKTESEEKSIDSNTKDSGRQRLNPRSPDDMVDLFKGENAAPFIDNEAIGTSSVTYDECTSNEIILDEVESDSYTAPDVAEDEEYKSKYTSDTDSTNLDPTSIDNIIDHFSEEKPAPPTNNEEVGSVSDDEELQSHRVDPGPTIDGNSSGIENGHPETVTDPEDLPSSEDSSKVSATFSPGRTVNGASDNEPARRRTNPRFNLSPFGVKASINESRKKKCGSFCERPMPSLVDVRFSSEPVLSESEHDRTSTVRVHSVILAKMTSIARGAMRHCIGFWFGTDGKWRNQETVDALSEVWTSKFWI